MASSSGLLTELAPICPEESEWRRKNSIPLKPSSLTFGRDIGRGSYGVIREGELNGNPVAVKSIHLLLKGCANWTERSTILARVLQESRFLEKARHPCIVSYYGVYYEEGETGLLLVMERMHTTLREYYLANKENLELKRIIGICVSVAQAILFLHTLPTPILHANISSSSIMLTETGEVKIGGSLKAEGDRRFAIQPGTRSDVISSSDQTSFNELGEKFDIFAVGSVMLEVAIQKSWMPLQASRDPLSVVDCREKNLALLPDTHPMKELITACLQDYPLGRPSAVDLHRSLVEIQSFVKSNPQLWSPPLHSESNTARHNPQAVDDSSNGDKPTNHESQLPSQSHPAGATISSVSSGCDMSYPADSTPLHLAVRDGSVEAVGTLLECGADPNVRNSDSMLPIQMAAVRNKASIIELLVRHGSYLSSDHSRSSTSEEQDCRNSTGGNAGSSWQMSSHLTEETHGSLANVCSNYPPLFLAIMSNSEEAAVRLLELGADPNTCQFKVPALSIASRYDNSNIVSKLIDCGAKLDTVDCFGDYPIHTAIKFDQPNIVCILVSKFPMYLRTNAKVGNLILTPFQLACLFCRCSVLTVLWKLQDDADCLSTTSFNLSPVHLVVLGRKLTQSADPFTGHSESPFSISLQNEEKTLNFLIIKRFPVSERDEFGLTALDLALQYEYVDLVYLLQQPEVNADTGKYARGMEMLGLVIQNLERQIGYTTTENVSSRGKLFGLEGNIDNLEKRCGDMEKKYNELQFSADLYSQTISAEPPESPAVPPRAPSPSWMEQYRKATKQHGSVTLHVTRCVLIGPPRVGKSSLKILLVRNEPQCVETSTDLMEAPVVLTSIQHKENGSQWKELTPIDLGHIVNKCTKEEEYNPTLNSPQAQGLSSSHSPVHSRLFQGSSISLANFSSGINETSGNDPHPISFEPEGSIGKDFETNFDSFLSKTMSERSRAELQLNGLKMVHLFDCGGQLAFQDTIPLLINAPCAFVAVFNASVDLDEEMELKYCREKGKELTLGHKESQWHMLRRILSSIHSLQYKCHRDIVHLIKGNKVPSSPVAVVGTHKDLLNKEKDGGLRQKEAEEKIAKRFEQLRESKPYTFLRERGCTHVLVENVSKADLNVINSLRKDIESQATLQIELPLSWIVLELFTRSYHLKQKFIPFDVLHQLCIRHKIVSHKEEFLSLLQVLHVLGFYAFYQLDGEEQNWVCTDAATLYREVTKILMVQHREEFRKEATYELKTCGRIKYNKTTLQDLFTDLDINISGADPMWFVRVLLHIGLAANVKIEGEEEEVFIPLALPCDRSILPQIASVATVCFTLEFPCSHRKGRNCAKITDVPRGIFPHLIVHLLSQQCLEECEWMVDEGDSRTCIKLIHRSDSYFIYLMDYVDRIEMALSLNNTFFSTENNPKRATKVYELCQNLHDVLKKALEATFVAVFGDQDPNQDDQRRPSVVCGFKCSTCQDSSHMTVVQPSVECTPQHPRYTAKCVHKAPPTNVVQPDQLIWFCPVEQAIFEEESTLHMWIMKGTLDSGNIVKGIHEFLPYYLKMAPHLRELGAALGVSDLSNAIIDGNGTPGDKCLQVLQCWLNQTRRPTWELFCQRLSLAGCFTAVAHDIAKDHGLPYP